MNDAFLLLYFPSLGAKYEFQYIEKDLLKLLEILKNRRPLGSRTRFNLNFFFGYSQKIDTPESSIVLFFTRKVGKVYRIMITILTFVNFFPPPVVELRRLSHFPAKITLVHAHALLSIKKTSPW